MPQLVVSKPNRSVEGLGNILDTAAAVAPAAGPPGAVASAGLELINQFGSILGSIFGGKRARNRKRREWRDKAMNWLYSQGVHHVNDTGQDGRYNASIKKLVQIVTNDKAGAVPIINQYLGQTITPAVVDTVISQYNAYKKALAARQAAQKTPTNAALTSSKHFLGDHGGLILGVGSGALVAGGAAYYLRNRKNHKK